MCYFISHLTTSTHPPVIFEDQMMKEKNSLVDMERKARRIKSIRLIRNTILANACYHTKEMENQIMMADKNGHLTSKERDAIINSWTVCNRLAQELIEELESYLNA